MKQLVTLLLFFTTVSLYSQLVKKGETSVFSFKTKSGKSAVLCYGVNNSYLVYRFGTNSKIELEYPSALDESSWQMFTYSYYYRGGGKENAGMDLNYISFENSGYMYKIYNEYTAEDDKEQSGIIILSPEGKETTIKAINSTVKGSLIEFRDNDKIKREQ